MKYAPFPTNKSYLSAVKITGETPHVSDIDSNASYCSEECNVSLSGERDRQSEDLIIGSNFFEQDEDDEINLLLKEALLSL